MDEPTTLAERRARFVSGARRSVVVLTALGIVLTGLSVQAEPTGTSSERRSDVEIISEELGLSYEETQKLLDLQGSQIQALEKWVAQNEVDYGGARFGSGEFAGDLTVLVTDLAAADASLFPGPVRFEKVLLNLAEQHALSDEVENGRVGVDATVDPFTGAVTTRTGPPEDQLGCNNDGHTEAGRFAAARSYTNRPYDEISSYSGCSAGSYDLCSTGFAVHQGSQHGVLTAGHCGDLDPAKYLSISWALNGQQKIQAISIVDRDTWNTGYWHDYAFFRERYENTTVFGRIYQSGQTWWDVTASVSTYPTGTILCAKLGGTAFYNTHEEAVKCGEIVDSSDGGLSKADSNFFRMDFNGSGCASSPGPGDSGSPVYKPAGTLNAWAYGIVTHGDFCGNAETYIEKISSILANGSLSMHLASEGTG